MTSSDLWDQAAADRYDDACADMFAPDVLEPAVARLAALADLAGGGPVLELAIGTGRVAVPLHERGYEVAGIELSAPMAAKVRDKVGEAIPVTVGEMETTVVDGAGGFGLVYLVFNTIGNVRTQDAQVACFANAAAHLRPGGRFVVEVEVPPLRRLPHGNLAVPFDVGERHVGLDTLDPVTQEAVSHHYTRQADGSYRYGRHRYRYVWPSELDLMARLAGMRLEERHEDWVGTPFGPESEQHVSVWTKG